MARALTRERMDQLNQYGTGVPAGRFDNAPYRDITAVLHPNTNLVSLNKAGPRVIERGKGIYLYTADGREFLDGMAGLWCTALGYGNEELVETAARQMRKLAFGHLYNGNSHDPAIELAEKLKKLAPVAISKVFFCNSGSEANDTHLKLIWYMNNALGRPKKKKIIARVGGFHGLTIGAGSLTGIPLNHRDFDLPIVNVLHTSCPHYYRHAHDGESEEEFATRLAAELADLIETEGPETVAAFIAEPVMGVGGVIVPPRTYFEKIMAVCERHDVHVISDEVICGFGRLGRAFGCEALDFRPRALSVAKGLSSGYLPIAAALLPDNVYQALLSQSGKLGLFAHGFTSSGHPVAAAVAAKTLDLYARDKIFERAAALAPLFQEHVGKLGEHPLVGEARGLGLMAGFELVSDKRTKRPFEPKNGIGSHCVRCAEVEGLIVRAVGGDTITVCPPLIITPGEIDELFRRLRRAFDRVLDWAPRERLARS